jgi:hypothetical protein
MRVQQSFVQLPVDTSASTTTRKKSCAVLRSKFDVTSSLLTPNFAIPPQFWLSCAVCHPVLPVHWLDQRSVENICFAAAYVLICYLLDKQELRQVAVAYT